MNEKIEEKNGIFLEGSCYNMDSKVTIQCDNEHIWTTKIKYIMRGNWCHTCGTYVNEETKEKTSKGLKKYYNTEEGKKNKTQAHTKRSETMKKQKDEICNNITEKKCNHCKIVKPKESFGNKSAAKDGLQTNCKECVREIKREWRAKKQKDQKTNNIKYPCLQCSKEYALKDSLTRHIKEKHFNI